jgi:hypothetical protein
MDQAKPHARCGPGAEVPIIQHKSWIILTPPIVPTLATTDVETRAKHGEECWQKTLGEDVDESRSCRDMQNVNFPNGDLVTDEVKINLDMLRAMMLNGVGRQVDGTNIVTIDKCDVGQRGV